MNYALQYTNRKRTISISVTPKMEVVVKAPKRVSKKEIDSFVLQKTNWITKKLAYFETRKHDFIEKQYINGEKHRLLGKEYKLQIVNSEIDNVQIKDDLFVIKNSRIQCNLAHEGTPLTDQPLFKFYCCQFFRAC